MKAESIEQIRDHLARGGRVTNSLGFVAHAMDDDRIQCTFNGSGDFGFGFDACEWELLPLEENLADQTFCDECKYKSASGDFCPKCRRLWAWLRGELKEEAPKPIQRPARVKPRTDEEWAELAKQKLPSSEELEQLAKDYPPPQAWYDEEPVPLPGVPASSLPLVTEDPTGKSQSWGHVPCEDRHYALRKKVLFGQSWSIEEQLEVWELLTGERIEHGRRCDHCDGEGNVDTGLLELTYPAKPHVRKCPKCINHPGYTVRPTWMGERV